MKVLICGGGTGGHIYPALSTVARLRQHGLASQQFLWIGTEGQMEETLVPRAGLPLETIRGGAIVGVSWKERLVNGAQLFWSLGKTARLFQRFRPSVLFMTGGYVNVPVALVAWLRRVPSAIFLPDVEPGTAIRVLSRFADKVACTTPASAAYLPEDKMVVTGYPVRPELREAATMSKAEALQAFDLPPDRPTLFVFGGSRGARSINRALMSALPRLLEAGIQVIHVSGTLDWPEVESNLASLPDALAVAYRPYPYLHERMGAAFRASDLALTRAGAGMLGEAPAFGVPAILVPYPHAWRYQKVNADYLVERGAALRVNDDELPDRLAPLVLELFKERGRLQQMATAASSLDQPEAADNLARLLLHLAQKGEGDGQH